MDIPRSSSSSRSSISTFSSGAILVLLRNCLSSFFSGIGQTRVVMFSALTAMLVNVAANYVLIFGHLGFPALGIRGAGPYGTSSSAACAGCWCCWPPIWRQPIAGSSEWLCHATMAR